MGHPRQALWKVLSFHLPPVSDNAQVLSVGLLGGKAAGSTERGRQVIQMASYLKGETKLHDSISIHASQWPDVHLGTLVSTACEGGRLHHAQGRVKASKQRSTKNEPQGANSPIIIASSLQDHGDLPNGLPASQVKKISGVGSFGKSAGSGA